MGVAAKVNPLGHRPYVSWLTSTPQVNSIHGNQNHSLTGTDRIGRG